MGKKSIAKKKYANKVCGYLDIDKSNCKDLFPKLYKNMKAGIKAA